MTLVSKSHFAEMVKRTPAAVSKWIREGKLSGAALVGDGRGAQVNVAVALGQLGLTLDVGQQLAQAAPILGRPVAASLPLEVAALPDDQARLLRARADREELELQLAAAKAAEFEGKWLVTEAARDVWSRQLAGLVQAIETWLVTTGATAVAAAAASGAGPRELGAVLKSGFHDLRQRLAEQAARAPGDRAAEADASDEEDEPCDPS